MFYPTLVAIFFVFVATILNLPTVKYYGVNLKPQTAVVYTLR